jgi:type II secretory pathway pseudopilin PulG
VPLVLIASEHADGAPARIAAGHPHEPQSKRSKRLYERRALKRLLRPAETTVASDLLVTMRTFFARLWYTYRSHTGIGLIVPRPIRPLGQRAKLTPDLASQDGFLLIEVLISTLLVGIMVIATYNGLDSVNRSTAEQRRHNEAAALAMQSQEQLRSDSATALLSLPSAGHSYAVTVGGTQYTITQKASYGNGGEQTGCSASEKGNAGKGTYILISSTVEWPHLVKPVTESGIITPPTGSALKINVTNGGETPTAGIPIVVTYTPVGTTATSTVEATTSSTGCALFAGIPSTSAIVTAKETQGIVTKWGSLYLPPTEVTLAPNILTELPLTLAPGGRLEAEFKYRSGTTYKHLNNASSSEITENVTGDTFVALNVNMKESPNFETGSNQNTFTMSGSLYEVLPDTAGGAYEAKSTTPREPIKYPNGNLFPFPTTENSWTVYAGDCTANNPKEVTEVAKTTVISPETKEVVAASYAIVSVPMTYLTLNVYHKKTQAEIKALGSKAWEWLETSNPYPVTITDTKCAGVKPDNETTLKTQHTQRITTGSIWGGHLEAPFQPFGEYGLCLYAASRTYTVKPYINSSPTTPVTRNIYLEEATNQEKETSRTTKEAEAKTTRESSEAATKAARLKEEEAAKTKRVAEELPAKEKREKEEAAEKTTKTKEEATKKARLEAEAAEKTTWESEISKNKKSNSEKTKEKEAKEKAQATKRSAAEATEKAAETKRKEEESTTATNRSKEETTRKAAETKESETNKTAETKENETRTAAETAETKKGTEAKTAETTEIGEKEVTIESGKASC